MSARPFNADSDLLRALRAAGDGFLPFAELTARAGWTEGEAERALARLRDAGYGIEIDPERAMRLTQTPERLIADDLLAALPERTVVGREIVVFEETNSTNDLAARAGEDGVAEGLVIFAETQRAGRGRLGRAWSSPPRQGLWFSILLRPTEPATRWPELTFCAALAVAEAAEQETNIPARIKWPNDVLLGGRKTAGILLECHHRQSPGFVVMGIGINVRQQTEDFAPELRERAGSLSMAAGRLIERRTVAGETLRRLERIYADWPQSFDRIMEACERRGCQPA
jgi:BirA family biotin operon repressor/biotin-[acetyl-CoA-carboxylase] ligase